MQRKLHGTLRPLFPQILSIKNPFEVTESAVSAVSHGVQFHGSLLGPWGDVGQCWHRKDAGLTTEPFSVLKPSRSKPSQQDRSRHNIKAGSMKGSIRVAHPCICNIYVSLGNQCRETGSGTSFRSHRSSTRKDIGDQRAS